MAIKVVIDGQEHTLQPEDLQLEEGYALITPGNIPKGYFTQEALNQKITERLSRERDKVKDELSSDANFHREIFSKYNVELGDDGKPKGLKPDFDPDKWKQEQAEKLTKPIKEQLEQIKQRAQQLERGKIEAELLRNANGLFREEYTKSLTGDDSPWVVDKFASLFGVDETGRVALREGDGFAVDGDGSRVTPEKYFKMNEDKFRPYLQDKRQKGSGFGKPGGATTPLTMEQINSMSDEEFQKNLPEITKMAAEGKLSE